MVEEILVLAEASLVNRYKVSICVTMKFGEKIVRQLDVMGRSQSWLAREAGLAQSAVSEMTKGSRRPYMDQALAIARVLGVSLDYLADDKVSEAPDELTEPELTAVEIVREKKMSSREVTRRLEFDPGGPRFRDL